MRMKWFTKQERDDFIVDMADYMLDNNATLMDVERNFDMAHSSMWWHIYKTLPHIDKKLASKCKKLLKHHIHHKTRRVIK